MESAAVSYAANDVTQVCRDQTREEVATIMPGRPRKRRVSKRSNLSIHMDEVSLICVVASI
jgi:hypothetical protein